MKLKLAFLAVILILAGTAALAAVPSVINYQGKLMQPSGAVVPNGTYQMVFSVYDAPTGGTLLWTEPNNSVQVSGGLFNVLLGNTVPFPEGLFDSGELYFGLKVGTDPEMAPRQRIASGATSQVSKTVSDGAVTPAKLADQSVTAEKIAANAVTSGKVASGAITTDSIAANAITTDKIANAAITAEKLVPGAAIPTGVIVMWSGSTSSIPSGWALCNGQNGTPDLRDRFIVSTGSTYAVGATGGSATHSHTVNDHTHEMNHTHGMNHQHTGSTGGGSGNGVYSGSDSTPAYRAAYLGHTHTFTTDWTRDLTDGTRTQTGGATPGTNGASNVPPYYALAFIMKLP